MKRKTPPSQKQKPKRRRPETSITASIAKTYNDYFHSLPAEETSTSAICMGSNICNKFFLKRPSDLTPYATKENHLKEAVQVNFDGRYTDNAVRQILAVGGCSFLVTRTSILNSFYQ
jgi:hypothetical protein